MNIKYYIADPTGNITALVLTDKSLDYKLVSQKIMQENSSVEQVGFVDFSGGQIRLRMSGSEFCGNATMSAAALYYELSGRKSSFETEVSVFGTDKPVKVNVAEKDKCFKCDCFLEKPYKISEASFAADNKEYNFPLVCFEGIMHIIADETLSLNTAKKVISTLAESLCAKALGIMMISENKGKMKPLVYVSDTKTLFLEGSCASGSCAAAAALCKKGEKLILKQPGGTLGVLNSDELVLSGSVKLSQCFELEI